MNEAVAQLRKASSFRLSTCRLCGTSGDERAEVLVQYRMAGASGKAGTTVTRSRSFCAECAERAFQRVFSELTEIADADGLRRPEDEREWTAAERERFRRDWARQAQPSSRSTDVDLLASRRFTVDEGRGK